MTTRRPLVLVNGGMRELPSGDALPPATDLDLGVTTATPDAIAVKVGGVWKQIGWATFLSLVGSVGPGTPVEDQVLVNGTGVVINGTPVVIAADTTVENQVLVNGEGVAINGTAVVIAPSTQDVQVNGQALLVNGEQVTITT